LHSLRLVFVHIPTHVNHVADLLSRNKFQEARGIPLDSATQGDGKRSATDLLKLTVQVLASEGLAESTREKYNTGMKSWWRFAEGNW
jgi:hypothetical protein